MCGSWLLPFQSCVLQGNRVACAWTALLAARGRGESIFEAWLTISQKTPLFPPLRPWWKKEERILKLKVKHFPKTLSRWRRRGSQQWCYYGNQMKGDSKEEARLHREGVGIVVSVSLWIRSPEPPTSFTHEEQPLCQLLCFLLLPSTLSWTKAENLTLFWLPSYMLSWTQSTSLQKVMCPLHNLPEILEFYSLDSHLCLKI